MAKAASFRGLRRRRADLEKEILLLKSKWGANWTVTRTTHGFIAVGRVTPDSLCRRYKVRIDYNGARPKVEVIDPPLRCRPGASSIPHTYSDGTLCLYHPALRDWTPRKPLAHTIVHWISEWLYYYEIWLAIGEWMGRGEHPRSPKSLPEPDEEDT
jgi:hypothetical protein